MLSLTRHRDYVAAVPTPDHFIPLLYVAGVASKDEPAKPAGQADEIAELKAQLASIQARLEKLSGESK